jgi:hypothetical protein
MRHDFWREHPDHVETLKTLHKEGLSFPQIAKRIPGATRNSVAGKAYRLGLWRKKQEHSPSPKTPAAAKRRTA